MTRERILQVLDAYYDAFNRMDEQGVLGAFTDDATFVDLTMERTMHGPKELSGFLAETWSRSPYFRLEPENILVDGAQAAARVQMSGAAKVGPDGLPRPADVWRIPSTSFFRFDNDKISWKADSWNMLAIPRQLGWFKAVRDLGALKALRA